MFQLSGRYVRLEPLNEAHVRGLVAATADSGDLYRWSAVPQTEAECHIYVRTALERRDAAEAVPFATIRADDGTIAGSTRFFNLERWTWPSGHERYGRQEPDVCEIGYTWLSRRAIRTPMNTEAKLLMLAHAFEVWGVLGVCFHTDARNERSRAALERIGAKFEGILRSHRVAADFTPRDSCRYSIVAAEWPDVKDRLNGFLRER